jgi:hypothetical protein
MAVGGRSLSDAEIHRLFGPSEDGMMQRLLPAGWQNALPLYFTDAAAFLEWLTGMT